MKKINKMAYYALKGMLAENADNLDLILNRLSFAASSNSGLANALVNGIAVDVKIKDPDALRTYLGDEDEEVTEINIALHTYDSFEQYIEILYLVDGKKDIKKLYLNAMTSEQWALFEVEYI